MRLWRLSYNLIKERAASVVIRVPENEEIWMKLINILREYIVNLGKPIQLKIINTDFSKRIHSDSELLELAPELYRNYKGRIALIRRMLSEEEPIIFILDRLPVDLHDWLEEIERRYWTFVALEEQQLHSLKVLPPSQFLSKVSSSGKEETIACLQGRDLLPIRVGLEGSKLLLDDLEFSIDEKGVTLKLKGIHNVKSLHLEALASEPPSLMLRQGNNVIMVEGREEHTWFPEPQWYPLSDVLENVIHQILSAGEYVCPFCGELHPADLLICPIGEPIFSGFPIGNVAVIRGREYLPLTEILAYQISDRGAVLWNGCLLYLDNRGLWSLKERLKPGVTKLGDVIAVYNLP